MRELILSNSGVTLADIFTAGGEVLMGTMRWEKESAERVANEVAEVAGKLKRVTLDAEQASSRCGKAVQTELIAEASGKTVGAHHREPQAENWRGRARVRNCAAATRRRHAMNPS